MQGYDMVSQADEELIFTTYIKYMGDISDTYIILGERWPKRKVSLILYHSIYCYSNFNKDQGGYYISY